MLKTAALDSLQAQMQMLLLTAREMIELARQGDFARVSELDQRRTRELAACLSGAIGPAEAQILREGMTSMVELHEVLVGIVSAARGEVLGLVNEAQHNQRAIKSYSAATP